MPGRSVVFSVTGGGAFVVVVDGVAVPLVEGVDVVLVEGLEVAVVGLAGLVVGALEVGCVLAGDELVVVPSATGVRPVPQADAVSASAAVAAAARARVVVRMSFPDRFDGGRRGPSQYQTPQAAHRLHRA
ncbi:MAG: hypothetical protein ACTHLJ_02880, partial [Angustibacter sp.]